VDGGVGADIPLLVRVPEEGTVVDICLQRDATDITVRVPRIDVRVKVDDRDGSIDFVDGFEDRKDLGSALRLVWLTIVWSPPSAMMRGWYCPSRPTCILRAFILSGEATG
jgi:hypothetical protein